MININILFGISSKYFYKGEKKPTDGHKALFRSLLRVNREIQKGITRRICKVKSI